jgi:hypothetical protein
MADEGPLTGREFQRLRFGLGTHLSGNLFFTWTTPPDECPARHLDDQVHASVPVHAFAQPRFALFGEETRLVILSDQIIEVVVGLQKDAPSATAIATARTAFGPKGLASEGDAAFPAVTGPSENFDLVNEHHEETITSMGKIGR